MYSHNEGNDVSWDLICCVGSVCVCLYGEFPLGVNA